MVAHSKSVVVVLAFLLLALLVVGCGTSVIDQEGAEKAVQEKVEGDLHADFQSTECPKNEAVKAGKTFTCTLAGAGGSSVRAVVRIENTNGDLEIVKVRGGAGE